MSANTRSAPTYLSLADDLEAQIATLPAGAPLPSEVELAAEHGVSRTTARGAMLELERRHEVRRTRGSGTYVARRMLYEIGPGIEPSWSAAVRRAGRQPDTRILSLETVRPPAAVREHLGLGPNQWAARLHRLGLVDGEVATVTTAYFPADVGHGLREELGRTVSVHTALRRLDFEPVRLWTTAEMVAVEADAARLLEYEGRPAIWRMVNCNGDAKTGRRLQYSTGWNRPDVYTIRFRLDAP